MKNGDITPEGYMIVFISEYFWELIKNDMEKISRHAGDPIDKYREYVSFRDEKAMIEFHKLEK